MKQILKYILFSVMVLAALNANSKPYLSIVDKLNHKEYKLRKGMKIEFMAGDDMILRKGRIKAFQNDTICTSRGEFNIRDVSMIRIKNVPRTIRLLAGSLILAELGMIVTELAYGPNNVYDPFQRRPVMAAGFAGWLLTEKRSFYRCDHVVFSIVN